MNNARFIGEVLLSNFRSFGPEVRLDLGSSPGVTVVVAPNGSGKTALLEAVELCVARTTKRVGERSDASVFIREGCDEASVEVSFGAAGKLKVELTKSEQPDYAGSSDPHQTLGASRTADIHSMLRLTHLFTQRDVDRLSSEAPSARGEILAKIPVLKELRAAHARTPNVKKVITEQMGRCDASVTEAELRISQFQGELQRRDELRAEAIKGGIAPSPEATNALLLQLAKRHWAPSLASSAVPDRKRVAADLAVLQSRHAAEAERLRLRAEALGRADGLAARWPAAMTELANARADWTRSAQEAERKRGEFLSAEATLARCGEKHAQASRELDEALSRQARSLAMSEVRVVLSQASQKEQDANAKLSSVHAEIERGEQEAASVEFGLARLASANAEWRRKSLALRDAEAALAKWEGATKAGAKAKSLELQLVHQLESAREAETRSRKTLFEVEAGVEALRGTVKRTQERFNAAAKAVAELAALVTEADGHCPLCLTTFAAGELVRRVQKATTATSPELTPLLELLRGSEEATETAKREAAVAASLVQGLSAEVARVQAEFLREVERENSAARFEQFDGHTLESARALVETLRLSQTSQAVAARELAAALAPGGELQARRASAQYRLQEIRKNQADLLSIVQGANQTKRQAEERIRVLQAQGTEPQAGAALVAEKAQVARDAQERVSEALAVFEKARQTLEKAEAVRTSLVQAGEAARQAVEDLKGAWVGFGLLGEPDSRHLAAQIAHVAAQRDELQADGASLAVVAEALVRWKSLFELQQLEGRIEETSSGEPEQHLKTLVERLASVRRRSSALGGLYREVTSLGESLDREIDSLQATVRDLVTPLQHQILRGLGRVGMIAAPEFVFGSKYKKAVANADVRLHGNAVPVSLVASEAEQADYALSFQLAFALTHPWCRWPGLLLDDPIQHHDVAHTAALFDLLTEMSGRLGHQVVITTHDRAMGGFLHRKLQADGVRSAVWELEPSLDGTQAKRTE